MADEVAARVCALLIERLEANGIDCAPLVDGLDLPEAELRRLRGRISWEPFTRFLVRLEERLGGPAALAQLGEQHASTPIFDVFPAVARALLRPRDLYLISGRWYGQMLFRNVGCELEELPDGKIVEVLTIPPCDAPCEAYFHLVAGVVRTAPRALGLPDARVELEAGPRRGRYLIEPPRSMTFFDRLRRRLVLSPAGSRRIIRELADQHDQLRSAWSELAQTNAALRREIEQRERAEAELRQAQKLEAVGRLAAGVAHDFNNLLTTITGYSDLVLRRLPKDDVSHADMVDVCEAAQRATDLTTKLLAFGRNQALRPEPVAPTEVVWKMEGLLRSLLGDEIVLDLRLSPDSDNVMADRTQLEQVVVNLCLNARDAMPQGGMLRIETSLRHHAGPEQQTTGECAAGPCVILAVEDEGFGMDEPTRERVFEPFFSTKGADGGTGLGLSIVYGVVRQSGGQIHLTSESGQGTRIEVHLPRTDERPRARRPAEADRILHRGDGSLLLVEDDPAVRRLTRRALEEVGYRVTDVEPGPAALAAVSAAGASIDLLVTDVRMPHTTGPELARQLRGVRGPVPVLYVSGYPEEGLTDSLDPSSDFLRKPFTPAALARRVRSLLDASADA